MDKRDLPTSLPRACNICHDTGIAPIRKSALSFLPSLLIALLPKCHFCTLAYSTAITLCSGKTVWPESTGWESWLIIGLALLVPLTILFNFRDRRSRYAILLSLAGVALIAISEWATGQLIHYYIGTLLLFSGAWLNGSLLYFWRKLTTRKTITA